MKAKHGKIVEQSWFIQTEWEWSSILQLALIPFEEDGGGGEEGGGACSESLYLYIN